MKQSVDTQNLQQQSIEITKMLELKRLTNLFLINTVFLTFLQAHLCTVSQTFHTRPTHISIIVKQ